MKYKVGDKVLIREWDDMCKYHGSNFPLEFQVHCGKVLTVDCVFDPWYMMQGINEFFFTDSMILGRAGGIRKQELKTLNVVTIRDGTEFVVYLNSSADFSRDGDILANAEKQYWIELSDYNDDLTYNSNARELDIMKVEELNEPIGFYMLDSNCGKSVLWER